MRAGIQGRVSLDVVVLADGSVGNVTVAKSLDTVYGLDGEAVKAVKRWQFDPGTKDGKAVPVLVEIEMTFTLR
jgi:protein TonB